MIKNYDESVEINRNPNWLYISEKESVDCVL